MIEGGQSFSHEESPAARHRWVKVGKISISAVTTGLIAWGAFLIHLNLSSTGSIELLIVVVIALRWGFQEATAASLAATAGLNFLFIPPLFKLTVADPANWVSLGTFELTALLVSRLSARARLSAVESECQRSRAARLFELSRAILLINGRSAVEQQLSGLIREIMNVRDVRLSIMPVRKSDQELAPEFVPGMKDDLTDLVGNTAVRTLRVGTRAMGTLVLSGWENDPNLADAIASLAAIAVERARAVEEESRAEGERDTERLRTAVLDGLAHSYKTPLTAIQTASSGLLALGDTNPTQTELISIVDEQATLLTSLTTRLLKTASLEGRQVRLRKSAESLSELAYRAIESCEPAVRGRVSVHCASMSDRCQVDAELVVLALSQLIDNAVKYADTETYVSIGIRTEEGEGIVTVSNIGNPIAADERERIFERFFRGSNAAGGSSGTGLGLSIVRKAAVAHGGRVLLTTDGRTTTFSFTVPT